MKCTGPHHGRTNRCPFLENNRCRLSDSHVSAGEQTHAMPCLRDYLAKQAANGGVRLDDPTVERILRVSYPLSASQRARFARLCAKSDADLARRRQELGITHVAVHRRDAWTAEELAILDAQWDTKTAAQIAARLGRSEVAVQVKRGRRGLRQDHHLSLRELMAISGDTDHHRIIADLRAGRIPAVCREVRGKVKWRVTPEDAAKWLATVNVIHPWRADRAALQSLAQKLTDADDTLRRAVAKRLDELERWYVIDLRGAGRQRAKYMRNRLRTCGVEASSKRESVLVRSDKAPFRFFETKSIARIREIRRVANDAVLWRPGWVWAQGPKPQRYGEH